MAIAVPVIARSASRREGRRGDLIFRKDVGNKAEIATPFCGRARNDREKGPLLNLPLRKRRIKGGFKSLSISLYERERLNDRHMEEHIRLW